MSPTALDFYLPQNGEKTADPRSIMCFTFSPVPLSE